VNQDFNNNMNKGDRNKDGDEIAWDLPVAPVGLSITLT
jgi:hypothetical protein